MKCVMQTLTWNTYDPTIHFQYYIWKLKSINLFVSFTTEIIDGASADAVKKKLSFSDIYSDDSDTETVKISKLEDGRRVPTAKLIF